MIGDPLAQILPASGVFRRNTDVQERKAIPAEAVVHRDPPGNISEEPSIDPAAWGNDIRCTDDRWSAEQSGMLKKWHRGNAFSNLTRRQVIALLQTRGHDGLAG